MKNNETATITAMTRIKRYLVCVLITIGVYLVVFQLIGMFCLSLLTGEQGKIGEIIVTSIAGIIIVGGFYFFYFKRYIAPDEAAKKEFLSRTEKNYDRKEDLIYHLTHEGKPELITYIVFTFVYYICVQFNLVVVPVALIYSFQLFFYTLVPIPIIAYLLNVIVFAAAYSTFIYILHKRWDENTLHR